MKFYFVGWPCWPVPDRFLAGGVTQTKNGVNPSGVLTQRRTAFPQRGSAVDVSACAASRHFGCAQCAHFGPRTGACDVSGHG